MIHLLAPAKPGRSLGHMPMYRDEPGTSGPEYHIGKARRRRKMALMGWTFPVSAFWRPIVGSALSSRNSAMAAAIIGLAKSVFRFMVSTLTVK
jgi:hypothetical protein